MKNILKYLVVGLLAGMLTPSCQKDDSDTTPLAVETTRVKDVTYTSAICGAKITGKYTESGLCYAQTENPTTESTVVKINQPQFESRLEGLENGKTYYVRAYATGSNGLVYGQQKSFTTYAQGEPIVKIVGVTKIGNITATAECSILSSGGTEILQRGFCYAKVEEPTINDMTVEAEGSVGRIIATLIKLEDGQTYYVKAFAATSAKTYYSDPIEFKTVLYNKPKPVIEQVTDVMQLSMTVECKAARDNELEIDERGLYYGTKNNLSTATKIKDPGTGVGAYTISLSSLTKGTLYYLWAYATNSKGEAVSPVKPITTTDERPTAVTNAVGNIVGFSALTSMSISSLGLNGAPVTEAGVCWSTSADPTIDDNKQVVKSPKIGTFEQINLRWLKPSTTYYLRAYATNNYGTAYGAETSFTTREDLFTSTFRSFNAGVLPYTNAIKYAPDYIKADSVSAYLATTYKNVEAAIVKYGATRKLVQLVFEFIPIKDGTMGCQIRISYTSADGATTYVAMTQYRVSRDADQVFTFSNMAPLAGNAASVYNSKSLTALEKGYLDEVYGFLTKDKIIMDWANNQASTTASERINGQIRMTHKGSPAENMIFGTYIFSYATENPLPTW